MTEELVRVLKELHSVTNRFGLTGTGVAGSLREGYTIDVRTRGGGGGGGPCPTAEQLQVVFSGVLNCGCVNIDGLDSARVSDDPLPINATFILDVTSPGNWNNSLLTPVTITLLEYSGVTDCSISPTGSVDFDVSIQVFCSAGSGTWQIDADFNTGIYRFFRASGSTPMPLGSPLSNIHTCGPDGIGNVNYGNSGTVTVTPV